MASTRWNVRPPGEAPYVGQGRAQGRPELLPRYKDKGRGPWQGPRTVRPRRKSGSERGQRPKKVGPFADRVDRQQQGMGTRLRQPQPQLGGLAGLAAMGMMGGGPSQFTPGLMGGGPQGNTLGSYLQHILSGAGGAGLGGGLAGFGGGMQQPQMQRPHPGLLAALAGPMGGGGMPQQNPLISHAPQTQRPQMQPAMRQRSMSQRVR